MIADSSCYVASDEFMSFALCDALAVLQIARVYERSSAQFILSCSLENGWLHTTITNQSGKVFKHTEKIDYTAELRRKTVKSAVKLLMNNYITSLDKWGILRGVRPTKLAAALIKQHGITGAARILAQDCLLNEQSLELLLEVTQNESAYLRQLQLDRNAAVVYIGVPFCPTRCSYCSFTSFPVPDNNVIQEYVQAVYSELETVAKIVRQVGKKIVSLYIGGGTPVSLPVRYFAALLQSVREWFPDVAEFTVECGRPELITSAVLAALNAATVSRICINPQSLNDQTLARIGRTHSAKSVYDAFKLTRENFRGAINMDTIAGLSGETVAEFADTLDNVIALQPENITVHSLALKRGSALSTAGTLTERKPVEQMLRYAYSMCKKHDYSPYYLYRQKNSIGENVGYCLSDCQCLYNIMIIEEQHAVFGIGPGAATKAVFDKDLKSVYNPKDYQVYIAHVNEYNLKKQRLFEQM